MLTSHRYFLLFDYFLHFEVPFYRKQKVVFCFFFFFPQRVFITENCLKMFLRLLNVISGSVLERKPSTNSRGRQLPQMFVTSCHWMTVVQVLRVFRSHFLNFAGPPGFVDHNEIREYVIILLMLKKASSFFSPVEC